MKHLYRFCLGTLLVLTGCTAYQLKENTIKQGQSLTDLEYEMVLDNIAMVKSSPGVLPWHAVISKAAITVNDLASPSFGYKGAPVNRTLGVSASRAWQGDWTFTPVIDPIILRKLRVIYNRAATKTWVHTEAPPPNKAAFRGHYGTTIVWVDKNDLQLLVDTTIEVLTAVNSVTVPSVSINSNQLNPFIKKLQNASGKSDVPSQLLLGQLPSGVQKIISSVDTSKNDPDTAYWLNQALMSGLNKTLAGWTTNEVIQFAASVQMSNPGCLPPNLKAKLNTTIQSNDLLQLSISLLDNYYPNVFNKTESTFSAPFQNNLLFAPGPSIMVPH